MTDVLQYDFMRNALLAAVLVGVACGIVGTLVVTKRIVFISGGISHAAFGGIGLGYLLGINPVMTALPFSLGAAALIGFISKRERISEDSAIGILWATGMALGILFIALAPGYAPDLFGYLFGSILTVPRSDIVMMLVLDIIILAIVILTFKELRAIAFDAEYASLTGVPAQALYLLVLCLVALSIIVLIRVAGIILVIALLTVPAVIARRFTFNMRTLMIYATAIAVLLTVCGLLLSFYFNIPSGATIVLVLAAAFALSLMVKRERGNGG
jgi:zinc transport system permease protein